ncbi:MAG TPA: hypothetical protein VGS57_21685 [Thermoanaerobaculia bacterium]|nr:hypothetical protein [Thermoanaerobaculia bacterium]
MIHADRLKSCGRSPMLATLGILIALVPCAAFAASPASTVTPAAIERDGQHDFDFEIGTWKTDVRLLTKPLSGSNDWIEMHGTTVVSKVLGGRANLVELEADHPGGHFSGLSLRLYDPRSRQWSLNFSNAKNGTLATPTIGAFVNGRGEFYDQELFDGRAIFVRFFITPIDADTIRFEQAYSADGGRTWEVNWSATDTRVPAAGATAP